MNTTSLIVEILVGGFLTFIWVFLLVSKLYGIDFLMIKSFLENYHQWSSVVLFVIMAVSYQLGWVMIHLSYLLTGKVLVMPMRKTIFGDRASDYRSIKNKVYYHANDEMMKGIEKDRSVIRLTRTGLVNFIALGLVLMLYQQWWLVLIAVGLALISGLQMRSVYLSLYRKFFDVEEIVTEVAEA